MTPLHGDNNGVITGCPSFTMIGYGLSKYQAKAGEVTSQNLGSSNRRSTIRTAIYTNSTVTTIEYVKYKLKLSLSPQIATKNYLTDYPVYIRLARDWHFLRMRRLTVQEFAPQIRITADKRKISSALLHITH
ncbi:hypothetical protein KIN20_025043 [Parelaphostrongylus tenuis]|uniref:Uncharacterized protein n=1 Tax=Parelaphostrongylus tenuis TaxID=148309 RepID=A0AAD5QU52_PARTN|nr:hypothetical protein KIN20_025043 [Parelaphostrongylus tenuis]